ncbi:hypothetical protein TWF694_007376 [Orbilia ellipsospora]|uniref:Uncharacterized protein n=1 Tax=Orbilia ellipsospora TaxID=2528407 RepID=A0AAV9XI02_9PEZI
METPGLSETETQDDGNTDSLPEDLDLSEINLVLHNETQGPSNENALPSPRITHNHGYTPPSEILHGDYALQEISLFPNTYIGEYPPLYMPYHLLAGVTYILKEIESHIAHEVSTRVLSREFPLPWSRVSETLVAEFAAPGNTSLWVNLKMPTRGEGAIGEALTRSLEGAIPLTNSSVNLYKRYPEKFRWVNVLVDVLVEMGIVPQDWAATQAFKWTLVTKTGRSFSDCQGTRVDLNVWVSTTVAFLRNFRVGRKYHYQKEAFLEVVTAAAQYFRVHLKLPENRFCDLLLKSNRVRGCCDWIT